MLRPWRSWEGWHHCHDRGGGHGGAASSHDDSWHAWRDWSSWNDRSGGTWDDGGWGSQEEWIYVGASAPAVAAPEAAVAAVPWQPAKAPPPLLRRPPPAKVPPVKAPPAKAPPAKGTPAVAAATGGFVANQPVDDGPAQPPAVADPGTPAVADPGTPAVADQLVRVFDLDYFSSCYESFSASYKQHNAALKWFRDQQENPDDPANSPPLVFDADGTASAVAEIDHKIPGNTVGWAWKDEYRMWSWHEMIAQLTDDSRRLVVTGPEGHSSGLVGCSFAVRPNSYDHNRASMIFQTTGKKNDQIAHLGLCCPSRRWLRHLVTPGVEQTQVLQLCGRRPR